jgi:adenine specific DNA methylase Mod
MADNEFEFSVNKLMLGDNLEIVKAMEAESVDFIYLDPPFFSNRNYEVIWGDSGEIRSFQDRWAGGISHYIEWLKERVIEMHRVLKSTGSIFLHCDWHADAYIRVFILDAIFGEKNFRGEIIWNRAFAHNDAKKKLAVLSDTIWYYSKSDKFTYNPVYSITNEENYNDRFNLIDEQGRYYQSVPIVLPKMNLPKND